MYFYYFNLIFAHLTYTFLSLIKLNLNIITVFPQIKESSVIKGNKKNACFTCQMTGEFSFNRDTFFEKNNSNKRKFLPQIVATFFYLWLLLFGN
ncbi:hypothetical protein BpHYR1_051464 [Brachionus plicatilis]|uniref:Uncharacterized protein n=1 Tax=Brachionus plicatilis TaxID=10195 RepID=A0A3M7QBC0_BRAPC|nr:hypothetical protein BpHYR1_051464 [Brachionus plicatilis]